MKIANGMHMLVCIHPDRKHEHPGLPIQLLPFQLREGRQNLSKGAQRYIVPWYGLEMVGEF